MEMSLVIKTSRREQQSTKYPAWRGTPPVNYFQRFLCSSTSSLARLFVPFILFF